MTMQVKDCQDDWLNLILLNLYMSNQFVALGGGVACTLNGNFKILKFLNITISAYG